MQADKTDALKRLSYIEGHLKGIRKMIEEDQYCVDILKQTYAVKRALDRLDAHIVSGHLKHCVKNGILDGRDEEVLSELDQLFELSRR